MKIVIPGGSGQVGTILARVFHSAGHEVIVLSRRPQAESSWNVVAWDGTTVGPWVEHVNGSDAVINLAGRNVNCRNGPKNRKEILDSRVNSTRAVGEAVRCVVNPPPVW